MIQKMVSKNENISKLRCLVEELSKNDVVTIEYKDLLLEINDIINQEMCPYECCSEEKLSCYEKLFSKIKIILNVIKN
jgi:hypothetical protein